MGTPFVFQFNDHVRFKILGSLVPIMLRCQAIRLPLDTRYVVIKMGFPFIDRVFWSFWEAISGFYSSETVDLPWDDWNLNERLLFHQYCDQLDVNRYSIIRALWLRNIFKGLTDSDLKTSTGDRRELARQIQKEAARNRTDILWLLGWPVQIEEPILPLSSFDRQYILLGIGDPPPLVSSRSIATPLPTPPIGSPNRQTYAFIFPHEGIPTRIFIVHSERLHPVAAVLRLQDPSLFDHPWPRQDVAISAADWAQVVADAAAEELPIFARFLNSGATVDRYVSSKGWEVQDQGTSKFGV